MNIYFWIASILVSIYVYWQYVPRILKWEIKPHAYSWLPWTILIGIGFAIQVKNHEDIWWAWQLGFSAIGCLSIFLLSLKYGEKNITRSDTLALISSLLLIIFWLWAKLILLCILDIVAFYPTWRKSYLKPYEENIRMYSLSSLKSFLSLFSLKNPIFVNWFYPVFLIFINWLFALYLIWRRKVIKK